MALTGKVAIVTGAAQGIGEAITRILLQNGAKVVLLDVRDAVGKTLKDALDKQYGQEKSLFLHCDVESEEQIKAALKKTVETFGGIDILCNNAGILNETEWQKTVSVNLVGVVRFTFLALDYMNKLTGGRGGVVVNTASMAGVMPFPSCPVYTATKHGVVGFTRAMAGINTVSGYGIRFNAVCPGFVQTGLLSDTMQNLGQFSHMADSIKEGMELYGVIDVSQVAECVLELVTEEKTGEALIVNPKGKTYVKFPDFQ